MFFGPPASHMCQNSLQQFFNLAVQIQQPIKTEKTVLPSTVVTLHGIEVDTSAMVARLPKEKKLIVRTPCFMTWAVGALPTSVVSSPSLEHLTGYPARPSIVTPTDRPHSGHHSATSSHQTVCRSPERPLCLAVFHPELQWCVPASSQYMVPSRIPESVHRHCGFGRYGGRFRPPVVPVLLVRPLGKHQHRHKRTLADCHCCRIV